MKTKIVITRPLLEAIKLKTLLDKHSAFEVHVAPAIEFQKCPPPDNFITQILSSKFILFPSKTSIRVLSELLESSTSTRIDLTCHFCGVQGKGSAELFNELFGRWPDIISANGDAESFVDTIVRSHLWSRATSKNALIVKGKLSRNVLGPALIEAGAVVVEWELYNTVYQSLPDTLISNDLSQAIFLLFSPSAAESVARWKTATTTSLRVVAFGPTTAQRARELGFNVISTQEEQELDALISNLIKLTAVG
jgi:uroporphyrinogen-III synthase